MEQPCKRYQVDVNGALQFVWCGRSSSLSLRIPTVSHEILVLLAPHAVMACSMRFQPASRPQRSVAARAWQKVATMPELKAANNRRVVVPVESGGDAFKIVVQELDGARSMQLLHNHSMT